MNASTGRGFSGPACGTSTCFNQKIMTHPSLPEFRGHDINHCCLMKSPITHQPVGMALNCCYCVLVNSSINITECARSGVYLKRKKKDTNPK